MIVHPGFGDLQKWILQVKYSLVAKEWVSDSKILKDGKKTHCGAHCSNPEVRIRKKMQPKFEAAVRTLMKRASKRAPT